MAHDTILLGLPLEEIAEYSRTNHIVRLAVFGSAARGELTPESDIDLLVTFEPEAPIGLLAYARIMRELGDIVGRKVDMVTPDALKPRMKSQVLESAIEIYAVN